MAKLFGMVFGNWKTTLMGAVAACLQMYQGGMSWKAILAALPTLLLGVAAKDSSTGSQPGA